ncbi:hypothetical protein M9458_022394, partial [Cirrhinus mrigala]
PAEFCFNPNQTHLNKLIKACHPWTRHTFPDCNTISKGSSGNDSGGCMAFSLTSPTAVVAIISAHCELTFIREQHWFLVQRKCSLAYPSLPGHYSLGRCLVNAPSEWYCDKPIQIINPAIVPLHEQHRPDFIFMNDNAPAHRGCIIRERLLEAGVPQMELPALSPDLNPKENLWNLLSRHGEGHNPALQNLNDLRAVPSKRVKCHASADNKSDL